jgi:hypothetical protein
MITTRVSADPTAAGVKPIMSGRRTPLCTTAESCAAHTISTYVLQAGRHLTFDRLFSGMDIGVDAWGHLQIKHMT